MEMKKKTDEIKGKQQQIASLEREIAHATLGTQGKVDKLELSPVMFYICFGFMLSLYLAFLFNNWMVLIDFCSLIMNYLNSSMRNLSNSRY
jgi:hypothetical protein